MSEPIKKNEPPICKGMDSSNWKIYMRAVNSNNLPKLSIIIFAVLLVLGISWGIQTAFAGQMAGPDLSAILMQDPGTPVATGEAGGPVRSTWNPNCMMCHQSEKLNGITGDSTIVSLNVDAHTLNQSVHGSAGIECTSCHTAFTIYPHMENEQVTCEDCHKSNKTVIVSLRYENVRAMRTQLNDSCQNCHQAEFSAKNMHTSVAEKGMFATPLCIDCHGGHDVQRPAQPPARVAVICSRCHTAVYSEFQANRHGTMEASGIDSQTSTCANCHVTHDIKKAGPESVTATPQPTPVVESTDSSYLSLWNSNCTMCHNYPNLVGVTGDSNKLSLTVTGQAFSQSVHSKSGLNCTACHQSITGYPHQESVQVTCLKCHGAADQNAEVSANLPYENQRTLSIELNRTCSTCHETESKAITDSMHTRSLENGNLQAPLCVDCHGSHEISKSGNPRLRSVQACVKCHESVYTSYQSSVHGISFASDNSSSAPTCTDCHGVHQVSGPRDASFRSKSVALCATCHQDQPMMTRYGLSADAFGGKLDNYHGVAISLFNQAGNDRNNTTPVCYDCHGIHSIRKSDDSLSPVNSTNLLKTCQKCHPEASARFANAGPGHGSNNQSAGGLWVERIYKVLILVVFGLLLAYIALDTRKRWSVGRKPAPQALSEE